MNKTLLKIVTLSGTLMASAAIAGPYLGLTTGNSSADGYDDARGFSILAGYKFNDLLAIEGIYTDIADFDYKYNPNDISPSTGVADLDAIGLSFVGFHAINDNWSILAKLGYQAWDVEEVSIPSDLSELEIETFSADGNDLIYSIGASYSITAKSSFSLEMQRMEIENGEIDTLSLGYYYTF